MVAKVSLLSFFHKGFLPMPTYNIAEPLKMIFLQNLNGDAGVVLCVGAEKEKDQ